ncbi:hypothetical protein TIFTF001_028804 [Ficus carica]|uniref:Uncharacterized protein n=1 Tax=Ficus carica TaxID=3494 RepID=A0AA88IX33_FICCA|nr:hypothetical protein TIFTF001_028804 [Ficus carica]
MNQAYEFLGHHRPTPDPSRREKSIDLEISAIRRSVRTSMGLLQQHIDIATSPSFVVVNRKEKGDGEGESGEWRCRGVDITERFEKAEMKRRVIGGKEMGC